MTCRHVCYKLNCFSYTNNHLKCDSSLIFGVTGVIWWVLWSFELQHWCHLYSCCACVRWIGKCHWISLAFIQEGTAGAALRSSRAPPSGGLGPVLAAAPKTNQCQFVWLTDLLIIVSGSTFLNSSDWSPIHTRGNISWTSALMLHPLHSTGTSNGFYS